MWLSTWVSALQGPCQPLAWKIHKALSVLHVIAAQTPCKRGSRHTPSQGSDEDVKGQPG